MSKATEKMDASLRHVTENELKQGWVGETEEKREAEREMNNTVCNRKAIILLTWLTRAAHVMYIRLHTD